MREEWHTSRSTDNEKPDKSCYVFSVLNVKPKYRATQLESYFEFSFEQVSSGFYSKFDDFFFFRKKTSDLSNVKFSEKMCK